MPRRPGHQWMLSSAVFGVKPDRVDHDKGIIFGAAIMTEGEAKGHGVRCDEEFVNAVIEQGNAARSGLKVRFGHPNMSGTALGTFLGRAKHLRRDDGHPTALARADIYLSSSAEDTPHGDLKSYVANLADEDPDAFGMSIVFERGSQYRRDADGRKVPLDSPEATEADQLPFVEMAKLHGADMVDSPAANPGGLFASPWARETFAGQMTEFLDTHPEIFGVVEEHPEVIEQFLSRYRTYLKSRGKTMPDELDTAVAEPDEEQTPPVEPDTETPAADAAPTPEEPEEELDAPASDDAPATEPDPEAPADEPEPTADPEALDVKALAAPFIEHFGEQGAVWFAEGKKLDECYSLMIASQAEQLATATARITQLEAVATELRGDDPDNAAPPRPEGSDEPSELEATTAFLKDRLGIDEETAAKKAAYIIKQRDKRRAK